MADLMLLEYKDGQFHHNMVRDRRPQWEPNTNGWETIALTDEDKAGVFGNIMECKLHRREALKQPPYTTEYIRKEWKLFCYAYNYIVGVIEIAPEQKEFIQKHFNEPEALARLGNGHFSEIKENEELPWAWEYDPLNFIDSNF